MVEHLDPRGERGAVGDHAVSALEAQVNVGEGACALHPCDRCERCMAGECCGDGVRTAHLPAQGTWQGVVYAPLGVLVTNEAGELVCHICGWEGHALSHHVAAHGVSADEYRAYFGLCTTQGLTSPALHAKFVEAGHRGAANGDALARWNAEATPEQRSLVVWNRERRAQRRKDYASESQMLKAVRRAEVMRADPARRDTMAMRARLAKRTEDAGSQCPECGVLFCTWTSRHGRPNRATTCLTEECIRSARSRAARTRRDAGRVEEE